MVIVFIGVRESPIIIWNLISRTKPSNIFVDMRIISAFKATSFSVAIFVYLNL